MGDIPAKDGYLVRECNDHTPSMQTLVSGIGGGFGVGYAAFALADLDVICAGSGTTRVVMRGAVLMSMRAATGIGAFSAFRNTRKLMRYVRSTYIAHTLTRCLHRDAAHQKDFDPIKHSMHLSFDFLTILSGIGLLL